MPTINLSRRDIGLIALGLLAVVITFCCCARAPEPTSVSTNEPPGEMDPLWQEFYRAAVNLIYFEGMAGYYGLMSKISTILLALMGVIGFSGPYVHQSYYEAYGKSRAADNMKSNRKLAFGWAVIGLLVLGASTTAGLSGIQERQSQYSSLARRWTGIFRSIERLNQQTAEITKEEFDRRFESIQHEIDRAEDNEPPINTSYWAECAAEATEYIRTYPRPASISAQPADEVAQRR